MIFGMLLLFTSTGAVCSLLSSGGSCRGSPLSLSIDVMTRKNTSRINDRSAVDVVFSGAIFLLFFLLVIICL